MASAYDYIHIPFEDELDPAADTTNSFSRLSPRGGVSLEVAPGCLRLWLGGPELSRASGTRACLRRRDGGVPSAVCAGRRSSAGSRGGHYVRARRTGGPGACDPERLGVPHQCAGRYLLHPVGNRRLRGLLREYRGYPPGGHRARRPGTTNRSRLSLYANYAYTRATFRDRGGDLQHPRR